MQQRPLVIGANAIGVFSSRAQILRSLDEREEKHWHVSSCGASPRGGCYSYLRGLALRPHPQMSLCYLSSATVARYRPSGEKHTDLKELMCTSLSSTGGSSWVWLWKKKEDGRPGAMATLHPLSSLRCWGYDKLKDPSLPPLEKLGKSRLGEKKKTHFLSVWQKGLKGYSHSLCSFPYAK